jgi:hypothetical protein
MQTDESQTAGSSPAADRYEADWQSASSQSRRTKQAQIYDSDGVPLRTSGRLDVVPYGPRGFASSGPSRRWRELGR